MNKQTNDQFSLEGVKIELAIKKGATLRFANPDVFMVARTEITNETRLVKSAEYLGKGRWMIKNYEKATAQKEGS